MRANCNRPTSHKPNSCCRCAIFPEADGLIGIETATRQLTNRFVRVHTPPFTALHVRADTHRSGHQAKVHTLDLRPSSVDRKFGAGREGRIEREDEDGLCDFVRRPPALHRDHVNHLLPNLGDGAGGKRFSEDRRVDGAGRDRVDANLERNQLSSERLSERS